MNTVNRHSASIPDISTLDVSSLLSIIDRQASEIIESTSAIIAMQDRLSAQDDRYMTAIVDLKDQIDRLERQAAMQAAIIEDREDAVRQSNDTTVKIALECNDLQKIIDDLQTARSMIDDRSIQQTDPLDSGRSWQNEDDLDKFRAKVADLKTENRRLNLRLKDMTAKMEEMYQLAKDMPNLRSSQVDQIVQKDKEIQLLKEKNKKTKEYYEELIKSIQSERSEDVRAVLAINSRLKEEIVQLRERVSLVTQSPRFRLMPVSPTAYQVDSNQQLNLSDLVYHYSPVSWSSSNDRLQASINSLSIKDSPSINERSPIKDSPSIKGSPSIRERSAIKERPSVDHRSVLRSSNRCMTMIYFVIGMYISTISYMLSIVGLCYASVIDRYR